MPECDSGPYARTLLRTDPRKLCDRATSARVWIGYLEYALEHHADHLPARLTVGAAYSSNYDLSWDSDAPRSVFTIFNLCQYGQLQTVIKLGASEHGGPPIGNPPPRRKRH